MIWYYMIWYHTRWYHIIRYDAIGRDMIRCGRIRYDMMTHRQIIEHTSFANMFDSLWDTIGYHHWYYWASQKLKMKHLCCLLFLLGFLSAFGTWMDIVCDNFELGKLHFKRFQKIMKTKCEKYVRHYFIAFLNTNIQQYQKIA